MKILIASDSFKNSLNAIQACDHIAIGIQRASQRHQIIKTPISDGGEGTMDVLINVTGGSEISVPSKDPLMRNITCEYGILDDGKTAVIEMAKTSGIELLKEEELDPLITSTYGVGILIRHALDKGCQNFIIGLGGSATNDGGMGMAQALGIEFMGTDNKPLSSGGGSLTNLERINTSHADTRLTGCNFIAACDVTNTLTGKAGASFVFGPQKGGDINAIKKLDNGLKNLAKVINTDLKKDIEGIPGAGAAGGLGGGIIAFLNGKLENGFTLISKFLKLEDLVKNCDIIISGEGKFDEQSLYGKVPVGIARLAKKFKKPLFILAGTIDGGEKEAYEKGITAIHSIMDKPMTVETAMKQTGQLLEKASESLIRTIEYRP